MSYYAQFFIIFFIATWLFVAVIFAAIKIKVVKK